jgi:hypothetical protein
VPSNPPPPSDMGTGTTPSSNPPSSTQPSQPPASPRR